MILSLFLLGIAKSQETWTSPLTGETIFHNTPAQDVDIPATCSLWENGCTTCGVNDGRLTFCSMVICQYSKCLPHCTQYEDDATPPDNCMTWHDGCNWCELTAIETTLPDGKPYTRYQLDDQSTCSKMMCSPIAWGKPSCTQYRECMVDMEEQQALEDSKDSEEITQ